MTRPHAATLTAAAIILAGCGTSSPPPPSSTTAPSTSTEPTREGTLTETTPSTAQSSTATTSETTSATSSSTSRATRPRGGTVSDVDGTDASAVAQAYARASLTWDVRVDDGLTGAQTRAQPWMTKTMAADAPTQGAGSAAWARLARQDAWTKVTTSDVSPDPGPPRGRSATRVIEAEVTTSTRASGRRRATDTTTTTLLLDLTRASTSAPWRVDGVQTY